MLRSCLHEGRKMLEGGTTLHWVYMQKFRSVLCPNIGGSRMIVELKMAGDKKKTYNLGPSTLFTGINT